MRPHRRDLKIGVALVVLAGGLLAATIPVRADTATANLNVTATVSNNCTISTSALAFGTYDPIVANASSAQDGTGSVTITCTQSTNSTISLGLGSNANGTQRQLSDGGTNRLDYNIYQDSNRSTVWGTGADSLNPGAAPTSSARIITVYGRIAAGQDVPAGSYSDTVVATVTF